MREKLIEVLLQLNLNNLESAKLLLAQIITELPDAGAKTDPQNRISREGKHLHFLFVTEDGSHESIWAAEDLIGLNYLAHLLANKQKPVDCKLLTESYSGKKSHDSEKARKSVANAIKRAISSLPEGELKKHLVTSIKTGTECCYIGTIDWNITIDPQK